MRNKSRSLRSVIGATLPTRVINPRTGESIDVEKAFRFVDDAKTEEILRDYRLARGDDKDTDYNLNLTSDQIQELTERYTNDRDISKPNDVVDAIRCILAENPNASGASLLRLNPYCPGFVQKNLALPLILLDDPIAGVQLSPALYELVFQQAPTMSEDLTRIAALVQAGVNREEMERMAKLYVRHTYGRGGERISTAQKHLSGLWLWYVAFSPASPRYILLRRSSIPRLLSKKGPITPADCLSSNDASKSKSYPPGQPEIVSGTKILVSWSESFAKGLLNGIQRGTSTGDEIFVPMKIDVSINELQPLTYDGNIRAPMSYEVGHLWAAFRETDISRKRIDLSGFKDTKGKAPKPAQASSSSRTFDITRSIREDVKKFSALPENKGLVTSVTGDRNSIRIKIKALPYSILSMYELPLFLRMAANNWGQYDRMKAALNPQYPVLTKSLHAIMDKYHWDKSDISSDYFNSNFYKNVDLDWNVEGAEKEKLRMELLAYVSNPQIKPHELVHVSNIFRYEGNYLPFQDKKPFMVAIGSNPQVAKLSPEEYKEVEEWIGTNLVVPLKAQRPKLKLKPGERPSVRPDAREHIVPRPRVAKPPKPARQRITLATGSGKQPIQRRDHGIPSRPLALPRAPSEATSAFELVKPSPVKPARKKRAPLTEEEKIARREALRESREPLLLRRKDGPFLIMGVPSRGHVGASNPSTTVDADRVPISFYEKLIPMEDKRQIIADTACSILRMISKKETRACELIQRVVKDITKGTSSEARQWDFLNLRLADELGVLSGSFLGGKYRNELRVVRNLAANCSRFVCTLTEAEEDIPYGLRPRLQNVFWERLRHLAADYNVSLQDRDLAPMDGTDHDVILATILRGQLILLLDDFDRVNWIYPFTEEEYEILERCRADAFELTKAAEWVRLYILSNTKDSPFRAAIVRLDGGPDRLRDAWRQLSPSALQVRVATPYVGYRRRR